MLISLTSHAEPAYFIDLLILSVIYGQSTDHSYVYDILVQ